MRRGRKYTKRIEIWQASPVSNGFGGNLVSEELITTSWCEVKTAANNSRYTQRLTDLGITEPTLAIIVTTRYRSDINYNAINQFLVYRDERYIIQTNPTNINFFDAEIEFIAVRET